MRRGPFRALGDEEVLPNLRVVTADGEALCSCDVELVHWRTPPEVVFVQWFGWSERSSLAFLPIGSAGVGTQWSSTSQSSWP